MCPAGFGGLSFLPHLFDLGSRILGVAKELIISCPNFFTDVSVVFLVLSELEFKHFLRF